LGRYTHSPLLFAGAVPISVAPSRICTSAPGAARPETNISPFSIRTMSNEGAICLSACFCSSLGVGAGCARVGCTAFCAGLGSSCLGFDSSCLGLGTGLSSETSLRPRIISPSPGPSGVSMKFRQIMAAAAIMTRSHQTHRRLRWVRGDGTETIGSRPSCLRVAKVVRFVLLLLLTAIPFTVYQLPPHILQNIPHLS